MADVVIYTDGGSRNNPGIAGAGAVIYDGDPLRNPKGTKKVETISKFLGIQTNNWAEYEAVALALDEARVNGLTGRDVEVRLDSKLVAEQLSHNWKIKEPTLRPQAEKVWKLLPYFASVTFMHIPREKNKEADALANEAMDRGV